MKQAWINYLKPPAPCLNRTTNRMRQIIEHHLHTGNQPLLDLGSSGRKWHSRMISLDLFKNGQVDIVADAAHLPFKQKCFGFILCTAVLEHVQDLTATVEEIRRCLCEGGEIFIDMPFLQPFHADPTDYRRYTLTGLHQLFNEYHCLESGASVGPFSGIAMILRKIAAAGCGEGKTALAAEAIAGWLTFWVKYFDLLLPKTRAMHKVASGLYFYGRIIAIF